MSTDANDSSKSFAPAARAVPTRSGMTLSVRPASPADEPLLVRFYERVSAADRRFRFFCAQEQLGHEQLAPLVETDHVRGETFLGFDPDGELATVAMLASDNQLDTAEVAISVRADLRGKGLGWAMLELLADEARARGIRRVISIEDRENQAAITMEREQGFTARGIDGEPTLVLLEKVLR